MASSEDCLYESPQKYRWVLHAYVLMGNNWLAEKRTEELGIYVDIHAGLAG